MGIPLSPQGSASSLGVAKMVSSQNLLLPLMPSTEDSKLHNTVSGLRFALQEAQLNADRLHQQVSAQLPAAAFHCLETTWRKAVVEIGQSSRTTQSFILRSTFPQLHPVWQYWIGSMLATLCLLVGSCT